MSFPPRIMPGDPITAQWLNYLKQEGEANRITSFVGGQFSRLPGGTSLVSGNGGKPSGGGSGILFALTQSSWTSGTTISCKFCDVRGEDPAGQTAFNVYVMYDQSSYDITAYNPGGGSVSTGCSLASSSIVQIARGTDGEYYIVGKPFPVITQPLIVNEAGHKYQCKLKFNIGGALSSESDALDIYVGDQSQKIPCDEPAGGGTFN